MLTSTSQVLSNWKFWAQMVQQLVIAASVNYWLTHFTMHDGDLRFWEKNEHGKHVVAELVLEALFLPVFVTLFGSNGFRDRVNGNRFPRIDPGVVKTAPWRLLPISHVKAHALRALVQTATWAPTVGLPFIAAVNTYMGDDMALTKAKLCMLKAVFAVWLCLFVLPSAFFVACSDPVPADDVKKQSTDAKTE